MKSTSKKTITMWFQRYLLATSFGFTAWVVWSIPRAWDTTIFHASSWTNSLLQLIP